MKTVIMDTVNAVNEHQGVWPCGYVMSIDSGNTEVFQTGFDQCVDEMATNYGRCDDFYIMAWQCADKIPAMKALPTQLNVKPAIDWSKAPSNCIGYSVSSAKNNYWITEDELTIGAPDFGLKEVKFTPRPEVKPVTVPTYTQSMADNKVLPSVGMSCMIYYNENGSRYNDFFDVEIEILAVTNGVFTFSNPMLGLAALSLDIKTIKPLTPPKTDTEIAIDSIIDKTIREMECRFELKSNHDDSLTHDDTQIGVEFATEFMRSELIQLLEVKS